MMHKFLYLFVAAVTFSQSQTAWAQPSAAATESAETAELKRKLDTHSGNPDLHYLLGNAYMKSGMLDLAKGEYEICLRIGPGSQAAAYATAALRTLRNSVTQSRRSGQSLTVLSGTQNGSQSATMQSPIAPYGPQNAPIGHPGPSVDAISIISGPPGTPLQIMGSGFDQQPMKNEVTVGGVPAVVTTATSTSLNLILPEMFMPQWSVPIVVRVNGRSSNDTVRVNIQNRVIEQKGTPVE